VVDYFATDFNLTLPGDVPVSGGQLSFTSNIFIFFLCVFFVFFDFNLHTSGASVYDNLNEFLRQFTSLLSLPVFSCANSHYNFFFSWDASITVSTPVFTSVVMNLTSNGYLHSILATQSSTWSSFIVCFFGSLVPALLLFCTKTILAIACGNLSW